MHVGSLCTEQGGHRSPVPVKDPARPPDLDAPARNAEDPGPALETQIEPTGRGGGGGHNNQKIKPQPPPSHRSPVERASRGLSL